MTGVLVWKVYREQRLIWLAMALLAVGVIVMHRWLLRPDFPQIPLAVPFGVIVHVYGLLVGAILLAGEREAGTASFLDGLPATRLLVWLVKSAVGVGLVLVQGLYLWAILLLLDVYPDLPAQVVLLGQLLGVAILGFSWGLFFSGWTRTSLSALIFAVVAQPVLIFLTILFLVLIERICPIPLNGFSCLLAFWSLQVGGLLLTSGARQALLDRRHQQSESWIGFEMHRFPSGGGMILLRFSSPDAIRQWKNVNGWQVPEEAGPAPSLAPPLGASQTAGAAVPILPSPVSPDGQPEAEARDDPWPLRQAARRLEGESGSWRSPLGALIWLDLRQAGRLFVGLALAAVVVGLLPSWVLGWPVLTLLLGVAAGVSVFAGKQNEGTSRFLAEQRLPLGLVWTVKVGVRLALALGVAHLLLLPEGIWAGLQAAPTEISQLAALLQMGPYLTLGLGHGFSLGCLCGILVRKPVVAGIIAAGAAMLLLLLWLPSLLVGGLQVWQYWGLPILVLLTTRLLIWPWATGQLGTPGPLLRLAGGLTLALAWFAGALSYRVIEVPLVEDRLDLAGLEKEVEKARRTGIGFKVHHYLQQTDRVRETGLVALTRENRAFARMDPRMLQPGRLQLMWPPGTLENWLVSRPPSPAMLAWLSETFREPWTKELAVVVRQEAGVIEDVLSQTPDQVSEPAGKAAFLAQVLVARGLQLQAEGDPAAFVEHLETGLALVRQVRHLEPTTVWWLARSADLQLMLGVDRWLEQLDGQPDLLQRVLFLLRDHEQASVLEADNIARVDYLLARNGVMRPETWVPRGRKAHGEILTGLMVLAWRIPWEEARLQRLVRQLAHQGTTACPLPPPLTRGELFPQLDTRKKNGDPGETTHLAARELMVALRLFQAETGRPAQTLEELRLRVLKPLQMDRPTGESFSYRVSEEGPRVQGILTIRGETFRVPLPEQKEKRP